MIRVALLSVVFKKSYVLLRGTKNHRSWIDRYWGIKNKTGLKIGCNNRIIIDIQSILKLGQKHSLKSCKYCLNCKFECNKVGGFLPFLGHFWPFFEPVSVFTQV